MPATQSTSGVAPGGKPKLELPSVDTKRWSPRRKAAVVIAIRAGVITREEARERYVLSEEELCGWETAFERKGIPGLRSGVRQFYGPAVKKVPDAAPSSGTRVEDRAV